MKTFEVKIQVDEKLIVDVLNKRDYRWDSIEQKIASQAINETAISLQKEIEKEYIKKRYNYDAIISDKVESYLIETIEKLIEQYIKKELIDKWGKNNLEEWIERKVKAEIENKLIQHTEKILSNLVVVNKEYIIQDSLIL